MRILAVAIAFAVTGLLGTAEVRAQGASMSMSSCGGGASAGAAGAGSVGGWSLAPEPSVKRKATVGGTKIVTASGRTTAGAWSVAPSLAMSEPLFGKSAPARGAGVQQKTEKPEAKDEPKTEAKNPSPAAVVAPEPMVASSSARPPSETKSSKD